jgi:Holliday junction resolvase RusA-like endonuclease
MDLTITALGDPRPQGSKIQTRYGGMRDASKGLGVWRGTVALAAREAAQEQGWTTLAGRPVWLGLRFAMRAPQRLGPTMRRAPGVYWHASSPDLDKAVRAVCDALTMAEVWEDDRQVASLSATAVYAGSLGYLQEPGVEIIVREIQT